MFIPRLRKNKTTPIAPKLAMAAIALTATSFLLRPGVRLPEKFMVGADNGFDFSAIAISKLGSLQNGLF